MTSFYPHEFQPEPRKLIVPTQITFRAVTATKSIYLSAYCNTPEGIVSIIQRLVEQAGGTSVLSSFASNSFSRQLLIGAQLPSLSSFDLWKIRAAIQKAGGIIETVRVNFQIRQPASSTQERPQACVGCRYYYGKSHSNSQLICAIYPYGRERQCLSGLDWFGNWR